MFLSSFGWESIRKALLLHLLFWKAKLGARWIFPCEERLACGAGQLNCRGGCCVISPASRTRGFGRRLFADPFPSRHSEVSLVFLEESLKSAETHLHHRLVLYQGLGSRSSKCWCRTDTSWLALAAHRGCSCAFTLCHERQGKPIGTKQCRATLGLYISRKL